VIVYACAIAQESKFDRFAMRGIERAGGPGPRVIELRERDSLFSAYNEVLQRVAGEPDVEALVLLHEDTEIRDERFEDKARTTLADESIAVAGAIGGSGVHDIDWWVHDELVGSVLLRVLKPLETYGTRLYRPGEVLVGPGGEGEVDVVDGFLLVLSPWAIRELRFDESLGPGFHGYDADLSYQARERGKRVVVIDTSVAHHQDRLGPGNGPGREQWKRAHIAFRRKWERRWPLQRPPWSPDRAGA